VSLLKKVGLALCGGAVRALAHIGVLKVFEREKIEIHSICGTSMGAIIGGLHACGVKPGEMESIIDEISIIRNINLGIGQKGLLGDKVYGYLLQILEEKACIQQIEQLMIPFKSVSVDLISGQQVIHDQGSLLLALKASCAIPGILPPVRWEGRFLVDGGVLNNMPVDLLDRTMVDVRIAVDVNQATMEKEPRNLPELLFRTYNVMINSLRTATLPYADIIIQPDVHGIFALDIRKMKAAIRAGERAAETQLSNIINLIS
jgi:NTE family protein